MFYENKKEKSINNKIVNRFLTGKIDNFECLRFVNNVKKFFHRIDKNYSSQNIHCFERNEK